MSSRLVRDWAETVWRRAATLSRSTARVWASSLSWFNVSLLWDIRRKGVCCERTHTHRSLCKNLDYMLSGSHDAGLLSAWAQGEASLQF